MKAEAAAEGDARAEAAPADDTWGAPPADDVWGAAAATPDAWAAPAEGAEPAAAAAEGEGEKPEGRQRREREPEEEDNTVTFDEYVKTQKKLDIVPELEARKANEGDDTIWKDAVVVNKKDEDEGAYFVGKVRVVAFPGCLG